MVMLDDNLVEEFLARIRDHYDANDLMAALIEDHDLTVDDIIDRFFDEILESPSLQRKTGFKNVD